MEVDNTRMLTEYNTFKVVVAPPSYRLYRLEHIVTKASLHVQGCRSPHSSHNYVRHI